MQKTFQNHTRVSTSVCHCPRVPHPITHSSKHAKFSAKDQCSVFIAFMHLFHPYVFLFITYERSFYLSLSFWLHSIWYSLAPFTWHQICWFHFFLHVICMCIIISLSNHMFLDIWVISRLWLLWLVASAAMYIGVQVSLLNRVFGHLALGVDAKKWNFLLIWELNS